MHCYSVLYSIALGSQCLWHVMTVGQGSGLPNPVMHPLSGDCPPVWRANMVLMQWTQNCWQPGLQSSTELGLMLFAKFSDATIVG